MIDYVYRVGAKWYDLGVQLELKLPILEVIKHDNPGDTNRCIIKMIHMWICQGRVTWNDLITGLIMYETVGYTRPANVIVANNCTCRAPGNTGVEIQTKPTEVTLTPHAVAYTTHLDEQPYRNADLTCSHFEYLDPKNLSDSERRSLEARLHKETRTIITQFSDLVIQMRKSLDEKRIGVQKVVTTIMGIAPAEPLNNRLRTSLNIKEAESIDILVCQLLGNNYMSFINYHLVEYIIMKHGTTEDKDMLHAYIRCFETYCQRSVFEVPKYVFGPAPSDGKMLAFKVTKQVQESLPASSSHTVIESSSDQVLTLGQVKAVQEKLAATLAVDVSNLVLLGAAKGCIELLFSVPAMIVNKMKEELDGTNSNVCFAELEADGINVYVHMLCGPPGKPYAMKVTDDYISLWWTKPEYQGFQSVRYYNVHYRAEHDHPTQWTTFKAKSSVENIKLRKELLPQNVRSLIFKVNAVNDIGNGIDSVESDPINLQFSNTDDKHLRRPVRIARPTHAVARSASFSYGASRSIAFYKPLSCDNYQEIMDRIRDARDKWYEIGQQLRLNEYLLDEIKSKNKSYSITCLKEVVTTWLRQREKTCNWETLIAALKHVGYDKLAKSIAASLPNEGTKHRHHTTTGYP